MTTPATIAIQLALVAALVIITAYAAGRLHQWCRHDFERDVAYREGYNQASNTLFHLAIRTPAKPQPTASLAPIRRLEHSERRHSRAM